MNGKGFQGVLAQEVAEGPGKGRFVEGLAQHGDGVRCGVGRVAGNEQYGQVRPDLADRPIPPASLVELGAAVPDREALARSVLALWADLTVTRVPPFRWPEAGDAVAWEAGQGIVEGWLEDGRLRIRR